MDGVYFRSHPWVDWFQVESHVSALKLKQKTRSLSTVSRTPGMNRREPCVWEPDREGIDKKTSVGGFGEMAAARGCGESKLAYPGQGGDQGTGRIGRIEPVQCKSQGIHRCCTLRCVEGICTPNAGYVWPVIYTNPEWARFPE